MPSSHNTALLSHIDCPGGGQVWVDGTTLYVGHMRWPSGTSHLRRRRSAPAAADRADRHAGRLAFAQGAGRQRHHDRQSREARPERHRPSSAAVLRSTTSPARASRSRSRKWKTAGRGVHRYDFDGRYAYISPTAEGYIGNIVVILDLVDPSHPVEIGRWWIEGQRQAGGEAYPWAAICRSPRCHHPLRLGDRLYVSYWHHGLFILDISDLSRPTLVSHSELESFVSASDAYLPADSAAPEAAQNHGRRRRGRRKTAPRAAGLCLDLRHHRRAQPDADLHLSGGRARPRRFAATPDDRLPSAVRALSRVR